MSQTITAAMQMIESLTCVRFERYDPETHGNEVFLDVHVPETRTCYATVGYSPHASMILGLHPAVCRDLGVVTHELLHVLGMQHTHQRNDRDQYVEIHRDSIVTGALGEYSKSHSETYGLPYDMESVMHYGEDMFLKEGAKYTMRPRKIKDASGEQVMLPTMGQWERMSLGDIAWVNRVYGCPCHYQGDDLPGAMPYLDWLKSQQEKRRYGVPHYLVPNDVTSTCRE
ncbi:astacin-like metalloprotease toxin 3 [Penaeus chinensis]|uniref:astacin-like metalloprotease toxin 3 n=1 Tax=Penaeus chinensis TaxID=139456 RepID=UPI001FB64F80|nr:astacin-like metalloprotease toxin 3 [Penaeus chinensis]